MASPTAKPEEYPRDARPLISQRVDSLVSWTPVFHQGCTFKPEHFQDVMVNLIQNPNILSSWLFRADILADSEDHPDACALESMSRSPGFNNFLWRRTMVRKLIPRNLKRDDPLDQTCVFYHDDSIAPDAPQKSLVIYLPHASSVAEIPFYHPKVRGVGYLYEWDPHGQQGMLSLHYSFFEGDVLSTPSQRAALNIISVVCKHAHGMQAGYEKRVQHDTILPQAAVQNRYHELKAKYARPLINDWKESTDPSKHVFEDLSIAAFLLELWAEMYSEKPFPGFVDIGCGNGLLVYLLNKEGYTGWGFDARSRKSWEQYSTRVIPINSTGEEVDSLQESILLPSILTDAESSLTSKTHNGLFPTGTFIISNHADELTPWTPILATLSSCPFISIPCCSHDLAGARYRAPPPQGMAKASTYASLVDWVACIGSNCGWEIEREMLRIPSTRNAALLGRKRVEGAGEVDMKGVIAKYGSAEGYVENVKMLLKGNARGH